MVTSCSKLTSSSAAKSFDPSSRSKPRDDAVLHGPVGGRGVVHAVRGAIDARRVHGGLGVVGGVLVGAGVAPQDGGELGAREHVAHAEQTRLVAVCVAGYKAFGCAVGNTFGIP